MSRLDDSYRILGISPSASSQEVDAAFRSRRCEFDANPGADPWDFQEVQQAYDAIVGSRSHGDAEVQSVNIARERVSDTERPKHLVWKAFFQQLPLQNETTMFIFINMMDVFMTYGLLRLDAMEANPIANYFLYRWGFDGMILLKMLSIAFVVILAQAIATREIVVARRLLIAGTIIVGGVVVYSMSLMSRLLYP